LTLHTKSYISFDVVPVTGSPGGEAFLVRTAQSAFLVEAGFAFNADVLIPKVKDALGARDLDYILLTHSHYDHAGGVPAVKRVYPDAGVVSSEIAARVFRKESAQRTMRDLDRAAAALWNREPHEDLFPTLRADVVVADGDVIETSDMHVRVIATPGHTRCCLSYYFEEADLLALSESTGVLMHSGYVPTFIVSYRQSLEAIEKITALQPAHLLSPHYGLVSGDEALNYAAQARKAADDCAEFVLTRYRAGIPQDEIFADYTEHYYHIDLRESGLQPENAFLISAEAMIPRLIRESEYREQQPAEQDT
jgi:glyoxylase-like metal-dependent hydrolase (beta-lactamase superfamily II)